MSGVAFANQDDPRKKVIELAKSSDIQLIEELASQTIEYADNPALVRDVATKYTALLAKMTGRPANEFNAQLMGAMNRDGVARPSSLEFAPRSPMKVVVPMKKSEMLVWVLEGNPDSRSQVLIAPMDDMEV